MKAIIPFVLAFFTSDLFACEAMRAAQGIDRNISGCEREIRTYGSPQPGGQCVALVASVEIYNDVSSSGGKSGCSRAQLTTIDGITSRAVVAIQNAQGR